jgi:hypothetical protein
VGWNASFVWHNFNFLFNKITSMAYWITIQISTRFPIFCRA